MAYMMITHTVQDYKKWRGVFDSLEAMRREAGERTAEIYRDEKDPNMLTAIFEWDNLEHAHEYAASARLKNAMQNAGVSGPPHITFLNHA